MNASPDPVLVGDPLTYTVTATNNGPSGALHVTLRDVLPPNVTFESAEASHGSCSEESGTVTCRLGTIKNRTNASATITVTPTVAAAGTTLTNSVTLATSSRDPDLTNNSASRSTTVIESADLGVTNDEPPNGVITGKDLTYTVTVTNDGPTDATGVTLIDTLPEGVTFVSATPSQGACAPGAGVVTCDLDTMAGSSRITVAIVVNVQVPVDLGGVETIVNTLVVQGGEADPDQANNSAIAITEVYGDIDQDGIGDQIEDAAPNGGDGDGDGIADSDQSNVTSFRNAVAGEYATLRSPEGTELIDVGAGENPSPDDAPDEEFPASFFEFEVDDLEPAASTTVDIFLPEGTIVVTYWKYGPTTGNRADHWYEFILDEGEVDPDKIGTGAVIDPEKPNRVTLHFVDGLRGDDDLDGTNGVIIDQGGPVYAPADISLTTTGFPDPVLAGSPLTYFLTVANDGPSGATGVVLTDTLPPQVTFGSAQATQGSCGHDSGTVTCQLGVVREGADVTVVIIVTPGASAAGTTISSTANVNAGEDDPTTGDRTITETTAVIPQADLSVTLADSPDPALVGGSLTYTMTVVNLGPSQATGVVLTNTLPAEVIVRSAISSQELCLRNTVTVTCSLGDLDKGAKATVTIAATVGPSVRGTTITATSSVTSPVADSALGNNSVSQDTLLIVPLPPPPPPPPPTADLVVTQVVSAPPALVGNGLTYAITVTNRGPSRATEVTLTTTLPADVTFASATPVRFKSCSEEAGTVVCDVGNLSNGGSATVTITVIPAPAAGGTTITNTVAVDAVQFDPLGTNNSSIEETDVISNADLSLTITDFPDPVSLEDPLTYTVTVANRGPSHAAGVLLTNILSPDVGFSSAEPSQGSCRREPGRLLCDLEVLDSGASATVKIAVTPNKVGVITSAASVEAPGPDSDLTNNGASQDTVVAPKADVSVTKTDSPDPVLVGKPVTYTLTVTNRGPSRATDVILTDTLPAEASLERVEASQGSCSSEVGTVTCSLGALDSGAGATVNIILIPTTTEGSGIIITNTAQVTADEADPDLTNNSASQPTRVTNFADVGVVLTDPPNGVVVGGNLVYTATITNSGPSDTTEVTLTDTLPSGMAFVSATSSVGLCREQAGTVTCDLGTIAVGAGAEVSIVVNAQISVEPGQVETITNTVVMVPAEADPVEANNAATAITGVYRDEDGDALGDQVEDRAPNGGDGDSDGVPDREQGNVTSLRNVVDGEYVTIRVAQGSRLTDVEARENPSPANAPALGFLAGFFSFRILGIPVASSAEVEMFLPEGTVVVSYWKYGPTPSNPIPHWYPFLFDGTTGAQVNGNRVTLHFVDGQRGDDDLIANGRIADDGAPVFSPADLTVAKTDSPDPVVVGKTLTYNLVVSNRGPSEATLVVLTDTLPADVTFVSASASRGSCGHDSGTVRCELGTLGVGAGATVTITVTVNESAGGTTITNTAIIEAVEHDQEATTNRAIQNTVVNPVLVPKADLSVAQTDSPDPVLAGKTVTYAVTVVNNGPSEAIGVVLTDTLPPSAIFEAATPSQGSCILVSSTLTCNLGSLGSGGRAVVNVSVTTTVGGGAGITNTAGVTSGAVDLDESNNEIRESTTVTNEADVAVSQIDHPNGAVTGTNLTYIATATNNGPSDAPGVTLTDTLPLGVALVSAMPGQGRCGEKSGVVTCDLGTIDSGVSVTVAIVVDIRVPVASGEVETMTNTAVVQAKVTDRVEGNNAAVAITEVYRDGDRDGIGDQVEDGAPDSGDGDGDGVPDASQSNVASLKNVSDGKYVTIRSPQGTRLERVEAHENPSPRDAPGVSFPVGFFGFKVQGLVPGASTTVEIFLPEGTTVPSYWKFGPTSDNPRRHWYEFTLDGTTGAEITGNVITLHFVDGQRGDDDMMENGEVLDEGALEFAPADISVTKTHSDNPALVGRTLTYTLAVTNNGPADSTAVTLTDVLPADVTFTSAETSQGSCRQASGTVTCDLGDLDRDVSATVIIRVTPTGSGTITNRASVGAEQDDLDKTNNLVTLETELLSNADLAVTQTDSPDPVDSGEDVTYTLTVVNNGPSKATGVILVDTLPANATFVGAAGPASCEESSGTVTCEHKGALGSGESFNITISVIPTSIGTISNMARVEGTEIDPNINNNVAAEEPTTVVEPPPPPTADLVVTQAASPDPVLVDAELTYTIVVTNNGPSDAAGVAMINVLPAGVTLVSAAASVACSEASGTITCQLGDLPKDGSVTVTVVVRPTAAGTLTNVVSVVGNLEDPDETNNGASQDTQVTPKADLSVTKTGSPDAVVAGDSLTYTLTVTNDGPSQATGVILTDTLPAGVTFDGANPSQGSCSEAAGVVTCDLGSLAGGASATVIVVVIPGAAGTVTNTARVEGDGTDLNGDNDTATHDTIVDAPVPPTPTPTPTATPVPTPTATPPSPSPFTPTPSADATPTPQLTPTPTGPEREPVSPMMIYLGIALGVVVVVGGLFLVVRIRRGGQQW